MAPETPEISPEDLAWDEAVVHEGRRAGAVVSVRLDADETDRLRRLAEDSGLNLSQVIRRALAAYGARREPATALLLGSFTHGGTVPTHYEQMWRWVVSAQLAMSMSEEEHTGSGDPVPTWTEPIRISERVLSSSFEL